MASRMVPIARRFVGAKSTQLQGIGSGLEYCVCLQLLV